MRRFPLLTLFVICAVALACAACARPVTGSLGITPEVGVVAPTGVFGSDLATSPNNFVAGLAGMGFAIGGSVEYFFSETFALGASLRYNRFGLDTEQLLGPNPGVDIDAHWKILQYGVHARYLVTVNPNSRFFVRGGAAFGGPKATVKATEGNQTAEATIEVDSAAGFEIGAGVMHFVSDTFAVIGAIDYTQLLTSGKDFTIEEGGDQETFEFKPDTNWVGFRIGGLVLLGAK